MIEFKGIAARFLLIFLSNMQIYRFAPSPFPVIFTIFGMNLAYIISEVANET